MSNYGERLRVLRKEKRLSQKELGKLLGLAESTISMYERNERQPHFEIQKKISDLFNVSIDYLVTGERNIESSDEFWKEILDPETRLFFKDLYDAPEESIRELKEIWEVIKKRRENK